MSSIAKVIEVIAESDKGWEDAARNAVAEASKTVEGIRSLWIDNMTAVVEDGRITRYRVNARVTFLLKGRG